jgi:diacylglycerol kinase family enzyme
LQLLTGPLSQTVYNVFLFANPKSGAHHAKKFLSSKHEEVITGMPLREGVTANVVIINLVKKEQV